eukprot:4052762-Prymnesium_polylepis.1
MPRDVEPHCLRRPVVKVDAGRLEFAVREAHVAPRVDSDRHAPRDRQHIDVRQQEHDHLDADVPHVLIEVAKIGDILAAAARAVGVHVDADHRRVGDGLLRGDQHRRVAQVHVARRVAPDDADAKHGAPDEDDDHEDVDHKQHDDDHREREEEGLPRDEPAERRVAHALVARRPLGALLGERDGHRRVYGRAREAAVDERAVEGPQPLELLRRLLHEARAARGARE